MAREEGTAQRCFDSKALLLGLLSIGDRRVQDSLPDWVVRELRELVALARETSGLQGDAHHWAA